MKKTQDLNCLRSEDIKFSEIKIAFPIKLNVTCGLFNKAELYGFIRVKYQINSNKLTQNKVIRESQ